MKEGAPVPENTKLTPLALAEPPSGILNPVKQPDYDPQRQYGVDRKTIHSTPMMAASTQTFDGFGKPLDNDSD